MKSTGLIRRVDMLGRVIIPKMLRKQNQVAIGDLIEIFVDGDRVIIRKHKPTCVFCGEPGDVATLKQHKEKLYCQSCAKDLQSVLALVY